MHKLKLSLDDGRTFQLAPGGVRVLVSDVNDGTLRLNMTDESLIIDHDKGEGGMLTSSEMYNEIVERLAADPEPLTYQQLERHCAGNIFIDALPDDWSDLDEDAREAWADEHAWGSLEHIPPRETLEILGNDTRALHAFLQAAGYALRPM